MWGKEGECLGLRLSLDQPSAGRVNVVQQGSSALLVTRLTLATTPTPFPNPPP